MDRQDMLPHRCMSALDDIRSLLAHGRTDVVDMIERIERICDDALRSRANLNDKSGEGNHDSSSQ